MIHQSLSVRRMRRTAFFVVAVLFVSFAGSKADLRAASPAKGRSIPIVLNVPTWQNCDRIIQAWNDDGLGKPFDLVCNGPLHDTLKDWKAVNAFLVRVRVGQLVWQTTSFAQSQRDAAQMPGNVKWFLYDWEHWPATPQAEQTDVVATSRSIRTFCDARGWKASIVPIYADGLRLAKDLAPYYDAYIVQCQQLQGGKVRAQTVKQLRQVAEAVHSVNPSCWAGCQLGSSDRYGDGTPGSGVKAALALYEATKDFLQIYGVWWPPEQSRMIELLTAMDSLPPTSGPPAAAPARALPTDDQSSDVPAIKPIESLWFAPALFLVGKANDDAAMVESLKNLQKTQVFDIFALRCLPPTFTDPQDFISRANGISKSLGGAVLAATFTVGMEGWETSCGGSYAHRMAPVGVSYDASKAMSQLQWLTTLKTLKADTWAWVLEQPAQMPTPEQAARSASEFAEFATQHGKKVVMWLSVMGLTHEPLVPLIERVCRATRDKADYFVWMDLPGETLHKGEAQWRETMDGLLDRILSLTPKEKTVIQWTHNPRLPTRDPDGTRTYISACQAKGVNRFCLFYSLQGPEQEPWRTFYRSIPKAVGKN